MPNEALLWLIPAAPLAAAVLIAVVGAVSRAAPEPQSAKSPPRLGGPTGSLRDASHMPAILAIGTSAILSLILLFTADVASEPITSKLYEWFAVGDLVIPVAIYADTLTVTMLVMVTVVATLVTIYAAGYMHGDPGYPRFFAEVSLFVFSMTMLVLSSNMLLLYVFWEAVGLCSYLLVGFWYEKPAAAAAARKAFLVNRIGDFGFALGIFLMWTLVGQTLAWQPGRVYLDFETEFQVAQQLSIDHPYLLTTAALLLLAGAVGKSAQFPLHVWLPDAMEGPTPVSALIHAATMVTAGVYMLARFSPILIHVPIAQAVIAGIGAFTALLAALIALTQYDLKRILAYSTVSQLGYMFLALGSGIGGAEAMAVAGVAAMFHLFTHAFFKGLLFLSAGSVMHAMGNVIDIRRFSGLRRVMPVTHWTFLIGALALGGIPPFSGFWSKDEIFAVVGEAAAHSQYPTYYAVLLYMAILAALLTAFYTFRAYFCTFWGETKVPPEAGHHAHESPPVMTWPLVLLAAGAALWGLILGPLTDLFFHYVAHAPGLSGGEPHPTSAPIMIIGTLAGLIGVAIAWWFYVRQPGSADSLAARLPRAYSGSFHKFYFDEIYNALIVGPIERCARVLGSFDHWGIDRLVDRIGALPGIVGSWVRPWQTGLIQSYAAIMFLGVTLMTVLILFLR